MNDQAENNPTGQWFSQTLKNDGPWFLVVVVVVVVGCWLLVVGCWLLVVGCWLYPKIPTAGPGLRGFETEMCPGVYKVSHRIHVLMVNLPTFS